MKLKKINIKRQNADKVKLPIVSIIAVLFLLYSCNTERVETLDESIARIRKGDLVIQASPDANITVEQLSHEFWFGAEVPNSVGGSMSAENMKKYTEMFVQNFNAAVTGNALKWYSMEPQKDQLNYQIVDSILSWADSNNLPLRGHNLFWGIFQSPNTGSQYIQQWLTEISDDELRQRIQERSETVARRYKGRFVEYDLNNEMIHGNYYEDRLGPEITMQMAQWTLDGDPEAKLWLNDYDVLIEDSPLGIGLPEYMAHIRKLLAEGVPIAGIGAQGHSHLETFDRDYLKLALDSLATFNLPIRITEFNLPGMRSKYGIRAFHQGNPMSPEEEQQRAIETVDFYKICFAHPAVEGILMWGFWEGSNWIPASSLYKRDWTITPTGEAYRNLVFNEWWTKETGTANRRGEFETRAFYGKYKVTVDGVSKEINLSKANGKTVVDFRQ
ncbi:MAG: endo-1,4-beta-xylanase [Tannerella sp.]|jgi:GH35 family endo-1,4-beta-xylanase|nr:endo-1,4-beta-xylanase [Tannerella sp.]